MKSRLKLRSRLLKPSIRTSTVKLRSSSRDFKPVKIERMLQVKPTNFCLLHLPVEVIMKKLKTRLCS